VKDNRGNVFDAMASGNVAGSLRKDEQVFIAKVPSSNPSVPFNNYFVLKDAF
jgi:hypothetical protein